ncbi:MAG: hypothetical protein V3U87_00010, partial [Methylococcaceae bacterium]
LAFLVGGFFVNILKQRKIVKLMRQATQERQQLEKAENTHKELLTKQKNDEVQIIHFQQQLEQTTKNLQQERNEYQSRRSEQDVIFLDATNKKQQKIVALNTMLDEKQLLSDRLEKDLGEQGEIIVQHEESQAKIVEMENLITQSSSELDTVKKQLKTELDTKNEQIEQAAKIHRDRVSELELQLKKINDTNEEEINQQKVINQESEKNQILEGKQTSDIKVDPSVNVEKTIQQPDLQAAISSEKSHVQEKTIETIEQKVALAEETNIEKQGVTGQVLDWFSSKDKTLENNEGINTISESTQKIETEIKPIIEENPISSKTPIDLSDVKSQLEHTTATDKEQIIPQEVMGQQSEENKIEKKQPSDEKVEPLINLKKNSQTKDSQTDIPDKESQIQDKNDETLKRKIALDKGSNIKNPGVVGQVLGWFSSMDKSLDINEGIEDTLESAKKVDIKKKPSIKEIPDSVATALDDEDSSFSEKLAEIADSMDSFPDRVKKLYHKVTK